MARTGRWHSHKCAWHAAFALIHLQSFLRPIIPNCLSTAESKPRVVSQGHLNYQVVLCTDFDCTNLTYIRALCSGVSVSVCDEFLSPTLGSVLESPSRLDEEHRLIARYAARLAAEAGNSTVSLSQDGPWWASVTLWMLWQVIVQCSAAAGAAVQSLAALATVSHFKSLFWVKWTKCSSFFSSSANFPAVLLSVFIKHDEIKWHLPSVLKW